MNDDAGEDIRWITESRARELVMPSHDFYFFDDQRVAILHFGENGVAGAEVADDDRLLSFDDQLRQLRKSARTPLSDYQPAQA
ncbi:DUF6879 family protein [Amycolatopsis anabasis]|uniref:DUF6879 family protein n=1 Tax=Amycolatopsis anabasis TaxID=1840409 RepID=UPI00131B0142|nr:DUF6879 family protein [Amycolatopsis anabasis]